MKNAKKIICALLIAMSLSTCMYVSAQVNDVGGGTWDYGSNAAIVWSRYYHASRDHHSSVKGIFGQMTYSGPTAAKVWSDAWMKSNLGGSRAWWGFDD